MDCSTGVAGSTLMLTTSNTDPRSVLASSMSPRSTNMLICWLKSIQAPVERRASLVWTAR